jgi:membrane protease YdiL (CAAX protease family)
VLGAFIIRRLSYIFKPHEDFINETRGYGKSDALLALALYAVVFLVLYVLATNVDAVVALISGSAPLALLAGHSHAVVAIGGVFLICKIRKQKFLGSSFSKSLALKSLACGFFFGAIHIALLVVPVRQHIALRGDIGLFAFLLMILTQLFLVAFMEELLIRAFIGPRFYGVFKNKVFAVVLVGVLFGLLHAPARTIRYETSLLIAFSTPLISEIMLNAVFFWLYARFNNIFGPILYHFMINMAALLIVRGNV